MKIEIRNSSRIAKALEGHVERVAKVLREGEDREVKIHVVDVSREGVGFIAPEAFDVDAFVRLTMEVDLFSGAASRAKPFVTACMVCNCERRDDGSFRVGARLKEQTGREMEAWADLISRWSPKEF